jgi:hypothetical protein
MSYVIDKITGKDKRDRQRREAEAAARAAAERAAEAAREQERLIAEQAAKDARDASIAASVASRLLVNRSSNNASIPVIYGTHRIGGTRVYVETSNGNGTVDNTPTGNEFFNMIIVIAEGWTGIPKQVLFGDVRVWEHNSYGGGATGNYSESNGAYSLNGFQSGNEYSGAEISINYHDGRDSQTVDTMIQNSVGSGADRWPSTAKLGGVAYFSIKLKANADAYAGGVPVITVVVQGKTILMVSALTPGLTNPEDNVPAYYTVGDSQNPADVIYDYLVSTRYGKGLDHKPDGSYYAGLDIDLESFKAARIHYASANGGSGIKFNGVIPTAARIYNNVEMLTLSCNSSLVYSAGKYKLVPRKQGETSVFEFNKDNILGPVSISKPTKTGMYNKITSGYVDSSPALNYVDNVEVTYIGNDGTNYLDEDNGTVLESKVDYQMTTNPAYVSRLNKYRIDNSRYQTSASFIANHQALKVECGDIVKIVQEDLGWDSAANKLFRVLEITFQQGNTFEFICTEYESSIQI